MDAFASPQELPADVPITFGTLPELHPRGEHPERRRSRGQLRAGLWVGSLFGLMVPLSSGSPAMWAGLTCSLLTAGVGGVGLLLAGGGRTDRRQRDTLILSLTDGTYILESGKPPNVAITSGPLSEIAHLRLTRDRNAEHVSYEYEVVWHPALNRPPYPLHDKPWSLPSESMETRVRSLAALAAALDVSFLDDSGWRGTWRDVAPEPKLLVLQPGEEHPVLRLPPPRKW